MKKILILMMTASLIMISGCKKGLDPQIYGSLSTTNFPKTEADFVNYVAEVYKPFQSKWGYTEPAPLGYQNDWFSPEYGDIMMFDLPTDEFNTYTNWGGIFQQFSSANFTFLINQGTGSNHFEKIRFVTRLTQIIDDVTKSTISTASKTKYTAEARMSRGWNMYYLLQLYGPVPVILDPALINTDAELNLTRPSRADFLAAIVSDLTYAAANLPVTPSEYGRFNQAIALTVLMRTYMNEKDFVNAEKTGRQIIALANTAGYRLVDDYASMFTEAGELNTETMFAVSCAPNQDGAENHANFNAWDFYTYPNGYPGNSIQNSYAGYRIPAPISATWNFYNSFDPADKRRKLLIASYVDKWDHTVMNQASGLAGPVVAKYPDNGTVANSAQGNDIPKARLGDVYLMLAEAINQNSGPTSEAIGYVNQVRLHHAGLGVVPAANTVDKATFDAWILKEEGWETYFEGYRKMDLVRHGQWPSALPADKNHGPYLFPVPTYEITASKGKLTQTPGYN
ncbi:RagB/SusD family nutrient uptake outer membrane protein [Mucilaginibacter paludis]|uniref:RagB/SusD domain-containing protein n=1 Tax=Mucilaginibacter paludis DSM 18603 TaxID=714943 RepID=H1YBD4_9SPHI|nr:RagB/SusD family nutrient uptake outer membrane protein [Mucilaginibacter paludis]EHQ31188.1 RagB/SusD domain-containing protein [Mucilaginibacter paludis DSM 18603]